MVLSSRTRRGSRHSPLYFVYTCRFDSPGAVVLLVQIVLLLSALQTGSVTHWKLTEDTISPGSLAPEVNLKVKPRPNLRSEDVLSVDPEFALLVRYSSKSSSSRKKIPPNRGGSGRGVFRRLSEEKDLDYCDSGGVVNSVEEDVVLELSGERRASGDGKHCHSHWESREEPKVVEGTDRHGGDGDESQALLPLTCGEPVVSMPYDFLIGISRRSEHKPYPEPEVAMIFKKSEMDSTVDLFAIESGLRNAYKENPQSITVLNQIGNFWRIKGDTQKAIECFRKALHLSSDHPDLLLNLARILFNLKFYDDAIFLAKKSLHVKSSDNHAWLQYFTLGEVYKALELYEEAAFYFRRSLVINPDLRVAQMHLNEMGMDKKPTMNTYTVVIITVLSVGFVLIPLCLVLRLKKV